MLALSRGFAAKLLTPAVSKTFSLSLFLSLSPLLSLSLSLSLSFSLSLSSFFFSLSLTHTCTHGRMHLHTWAHQRCARSNPTCFLLPMSVFCVQKKAARSRSGDKWRPECLRQNSFWERCLKRCSLIPGAIPQTSRSRQTPRLGEKTAAASGLWRAWQKASKTASGKEGQELVLASASFKLSGGLHRHHSFVPASRPAATKLQWAISIVREIEHGWKLWGGLCPACCQADRGYETSR